MSNLILLRGGGDLASGIALRLRHAGFKVVIAELPAPLAVRRTVSFAEAVYAGHMVVEGVSAELAGSAEEALALAARGMIAVLVDPQAAVLRQGDFGVLVDARLTKMPPETTIASAALTIGVGPGFVAGQDVHAVVETQRGHMLGRVYWQGSASADSGQPEGDPRRVLRAPANGPLMAGAAIGEHVAPGQVLAEVGGQPVVAPFKGVLRGLIHPGIGLTKGMKIGDVDPRDNPSYCFLVSDKALAVGGGVLEAILTPEQQRRRGR